MKRAVVDQPGLKIIVIGILIAIFFGLSIRSQITDRKVESHLNKAIENFQSRNQNQKINIEFTKAHLSLTEWALPFPHLVIKNIKITSSKPECADNQIYIESVDVPIWWRKIILGNKNPSTFFEALIISQTELRINNIDKCLDSHKPENVIGAASDSTEKNQLEVPFDPQTEILSQRKSNLNIFFDKIKIVDKQNYNLPITLQMTNANIVFDPKNLQNIDLKSQLYLFKDLNTGLYQLKTEINFDYSKKSIENINAHLNLNGKLIDKPFEVNFQYDHANQKITANHRMSDLSIKAIVKLLNKNDRTSAFLQQIDGITGLVLSNYGQGAYDLKSNELIGYKISDLILSSGDSRAVVHTIDLTNLKPLMMKPIQIQFSEFDLEKIKSMAALSSIQKSISNLGKISGTINIDENRKISSAGKITGLELIFSNRGRRAYQKVDEFTYEANPEKLFINNFILEDDKVVGDVLAKIEQDSKTGKAIHNVNLKLTKVKLNENVFEIFGVKQNKKTSIDLSAKLNQNVISANLKFDYLGSTNFESNQIEGVFKAQVDSVSNKLLNPMLDLSIRNLKIKKSTDESYNIVLDQLELMPDQKPEDYYFDSVKLRYARDNIKSYKVEVSANYFSKLRNEKQKIKIESDYENASSALFMLSLESNETQKPVMIQADLNKFKFVIKN